MHRPTTEWNTLGEGRDGRQAAADRWLWATELWVQSTLVPSACLRLDSGSIPRAVHPSAEGEAAFHRCDDRCVVRGHDALVPLRYY